MMNKKTTTVALATLAMALTTSCSTSKKAQEQVQKGTTSIEASKGNVENMDPEYLVLSDAQQAFAKKNNQFALNFFSQVAGFDSKVISPLSLTYLMGMLANGADGQTQQEILKALGCDGDMSLDELNALSRSMMQYAGKADPATTVNIANYIALNKHYTLKDAFAKEVADNYQAGIESLDFGSSKTTSHINEWCKKHTNGMIPTIIDQVDANAISYIMNAIYFNGSWEKKFKKSETKMENFKGYTRDMKRVNMMHRVGKYFFADNEQFSAVNMPYGNGAYAMTVLLPREGKSIDEMMKSLDADKLAALSGKMEECVVDLKLPRFTTELELPLNEIVSKLGAPSMFDSSKANFSKLADGNVYISKMLQKAKIEVSEEGTKAAAVTAAAVMLTSLQPDPRRVEFHANRPFVYMITDVRSGYIYFIGQFTGENENN